MESFPKIRAAIEAIPAMHEGKQVLVLHDQTGVAADLVVEAGAASILALLDGRNSLRDIQVAFMRRQGLGLIPLEDIEGLVAKLDAQLLLDNERFREHWRKLSEEFRRSKVRPAAHAGRAYPDERKALASRLEGYFRSLEEEAFPSKEDKPGPPAGLIVPHIDFERGGPCYARGYQTLGSRRDPELFVILGTSHLPMELPFALSDKTFETPLGRTPSAADLAEAVVKRAGMDLFADELVHRSEHTIEFQVVFLQYLLGEKRDFRILPVLCSGFHEMIATRSLPSGHAPYRRGLEALRQTLEASAERICVIASADLSHLGPQFGDPQPIHSFDLPGIQQEDLRMIDAILQGDADGFYRGIMAEGDRRRICGLPPIFTLLQLLSPAEIRLLKYDQAFNPQATVTFASIGLW